MKWDEQVTVEILFYGDAQDEQAVIQQFVGRIARFTNLEFEFDETDAVSVRRGITILRPSQIEKTRERFLEYLSNYSPLDSLEEGFDQEDAGKQVCMSGFGIEENGITNGYIYISPSANSETAAKCVTRNLPSFLGLPDAPETAFSELLVGDVSLDEHVGSKVLTLLYSDELEFGMSREVSLEIVRELLSSDD